MAVKEPFTELVIQKQPHGFYQDNSLPIALISKGIMVALVLWALIWPPMPTARWEASTANCWRCLISFTS